ncbi:NarK/NasA family nitrate transporter [bacterium]|nr:MAG: NarK/NasA family nitrate transporter [bacterium]
MRQRQLFLSTLAFMISFALWGSIAALAPRLRVQYGLTEEQTALAVAVPVLLGSLTRIPLGALADRLGGRVVFTALLAFGALPAAALTLFHSYVALLVGGFFLGIAGASFAVGVAFSTRWFAQEQQGLALGIFGIGNVGQSVVAFSAPLIARSLGWEAVFWIFGSASLVWAAIFWIFARDAGPPRSISLRHVAGVLARERLSWVLAYFYFITFGGFVALAIYLPTLLRVQFNVTLEDAGMRTAIFVLVATAMRPLGGWLSDRVGGARVLTVVFAMIVLCALALVSQSFAVFSTGALVGATMLGLGNGAVFKLVPKYFPADVGTVTGLVGAFGGLGGFFPPLVLGVLEEATGSYAIGFLLLGAFAVAAAATNLAVFDRPVAGRIPVK